VKAVGKAVEGGTTATINFVADKAVELKEAHAQRLAYKASDADFNKWLAQPRNRGANNAMIFYKGARKEAGVASAKFWRGANIASGVVNAATAATGSPLNAAATGLNIGVAPILKAEVINAERKARELTIKMANRKPGAKRLQQWIKDGIVSPDFTI
jgi:hypothetical protein